MKTCAAVGCSSELLKGNGLSFHSFPRRPDRLAAWTEAVRCGRLNWRPKKTHHLCSKHFDEACFDRTGQNTRLREFAVPTKMTLLRACTGGVLPVHQGRIEKTADPSCHDATKDTAATPETVETQTIQILDVFSNANASANGMPPPKRGSIIRRTRAPVAPPNTPTAPGAVTANGPTPNTAPGPVQPPTFNLVQVAAPRQPTADRVPGLRFSTLAPQPVVRLSETSPVVKVGPMSMDNVYIVVQPPPFNQYVTQTAPVPYEQVFRASHPAPSVYRVPLPPPAVGAGGRLPPGRRDGAASPDGPGRREQIRGEHGYHWVPRLYAGGRMKRPAILRRKVNVGGKAEASRQGDGKNADDDRNIVQDHAPEDTPPPKKRKRKTQQTLTDTSENITVTPDILSDAPEALGDTQDILTAEVITDAPEFYTIPPEAVSNNAVTPQDTSVTPDDVTVTPGDAGPTVTPVDIMAVPEVLSDAPGAKPPDRAPSREEVERDSQQSGIKPSRLVRNKSAKPKNSSWQNRDLLSFSNVCETLATAASSPNVVLDIGTPSADRSSPRPHDPVDSPIPATRIPAAPGAMRPILPRPLPPSRLLGILNVSARPSAPPVRPAVQPPPAVYYAKTSATTFKQLCSECSVAPNIPVPGTSPDVGASTMSGPSVTVGGFSKRLCSKCASSPDIPMQLLVPNKRSLGSGGVFVESCPTNPTPLLVSNVRSLTDAAQPPRRSRAAQRANVEPALPPSIERKWAGVQATMSACRKKVKLLRRQTRRLQRRLAAQTAQLARERAERDDGGWTEALPGVAGEMVRREVAYGATGRKSRKPISAVLKAFAEDLFKRSHRAYRHVRKAFPGSLPHPWTVQTWMLKTVNEVINEVACGVDGSAVVGRGRAGNADYLDIVNELAFDGDCNADLSNTIDEVACGGDGNADSSDVVDVVAHGRDGTADGSDIIYEVAQGTYGTADGSDIIYEVAHVRDGTADGSDIIYEVALGGEGTADGSDIIEEVAHGRIEYADGI